MRSGCLAGDGIELTAVRLGLSQILALHSILTIEMDFSAPDVVERIDGSECHCQEAEAPVEG